VTEIETLGDALPKEMTRVRDELMPIYLEIGPAGKFALGMMQRSLDRAAKAMIEGDLPAMIRCCQELRCYTE